MQPASGNRILSLAYFSTNSETGNGKLEVDMLVNNNSSQAQALSGDQLISSWLSERQDLILLLCAVTGLEQYTPQGTPQEIKVQAFCQVLIDYISAGHFEIYQQLLKEGQEHHPDTLSEALRIMPLLGESTELALHFNEDFDTAEHSRLLKTSLPKMLSELGEKLVERFVIEDHIIKLLHEAPRTIAA